MSSGSFLHSARHLRRLWPFVRPNLGQISVGMVMVAVYGIMSMQVPKILAHFIDFIGGKTEQLAEWETDPTLWICMHTVQPLLGRAPEIDQLGRASFLVSMLAVSIVAGLALFGGRYAIIGTSRYAERRLRGGFFQHLQRLTPSFYHENRTGDLMTRSASDVEQVRMLLGPGLMYPAQTTWIVVLVLSYMFGRDSGLAFVVLLPIVVLCLYVNYWTRIIHRHHLAAQETYSSLSSHVQENLSGIRVVKSYLQEDAEIERFGAINETYMERNMAMVRVRAKAWPLLHFIGGMGMVILFYAGGLRVIAGAMTVGELWRFVSYYLMLFWPMVAFGWIMNVVFRGTVSWQRIDAILQTEPLVDDTRGAANVALGPPNIAFRDLTFRYPGSEQSVLRDVSVSIEAGSTVAVVGPTGCGKSTLVNVLNHFFPVEPGRIFVGGRDITEIPLRQLREQIAYVSQDVFLFSTTIRENILFGLPETEEATEEQVEAMNAASRLAQLDNEVAGFSDGYETVLGERGITLSGGQRQRLGIARALVLKRPILLLDDCLSAVDTHTEEELLSGLRGEMSGRTTILISHRVSTVKHADTIIVLDDGCITERGTHDELVQQGGLYASMHQRQLLEESLGIRS